MVYVQFATDCRNVKRMKLSELAKLTGARVEGATDDVEIMARRGSMKPARDT